MSYGAEFSLDQLKDMKNLEKLELCIDDDFEGLDTLKNYPQITTLSIAAYQGLDSFDFLADLTQLTSLTLVGDRYISRDYSAMKSLTNLKKLVFMDNSKGSSNILDILPYLSNLESLDIKTMFHNFEFLKDFNNLEALYIATPNEEAISIEALAELPNLKTLNVFYTNIDDINVLTKSQSLRTIYYPKDWNNSPLDPSFIQNDAPWIKCVDIEY